MLFFLPWSVMHLGLAELIAVFPSQNLCQFVQLAVAYTVEHTTVFINLSDMRTFYFHQSDSFCFSLFPCDSTLMFKTPNLFPYSFKVV